MRMLAWRACLLALCCALAASPRAVAAPVNADVPRTKVETFFNTIIQGDAAKAFDTVLAGSGISANKPGLSSILRRELQTSVSTYGKALGYDYVEQKAFGNSLVRLVYILRLEKAPLTWEFFFYQSNGEAWTLIDARFNDRLDVYRYDRVPATGDASAP